MQNSPEEDKWSANRRGGSIQVGGGVGHEVSSGLRTRALYHWPRRSPKVTAWIALIKPRPCQLLHLLFSDSPLTWKVTGAGS